MGFLKFFVLWNIKTLKSFYYRFDKVFKAVLCFILMRLVKVKRGRKSFKKEFKRQLKYAIAAAVGLMIAYSWKEAIWNSAEEIVEKIVDNAKMSISNISTAVFITIIGVVIILVSSRLLRDK